MPTIFALITMGRMIGCSLLLQNRPTFLIFIFLIGEGNLIFTNQDFESNIPENGWQELFNNEPVAQGFYVYYIIADVNNTEIKITGEITVSK